MQLLSLGPASGKFPSIAADPLGLAVVYHDEATGLVPLVQLDLEGVRRVPDFPFNAHGAPDAYPTIYVDSRQRTWLAYRDNADLHGYLFNVTGGAITDLGVVPGARPFAFGVDHVAWLSSGDWQITEALLARVADRTSWAVCPERAAGTGLSHLADTDVWTIDELRTTVPGMANPQRAGRCVVGEADRNGQPCNVARLDDGREAVLWPGKLSFTPRIAEAAGRYYVVTWGAPDGVRLAILEDSDFTAPKVPEPPPPAPVPLPDIPWKTDPAGVVEDIWPWLAAHFTALSPDGRVGFILKSDEVSADGVTIGEWWDQDDHYIGHLEDASTGHRIYQGQRYYAHEWVALGQPVPWASLPLARNRFDDGARLWMPRRCQTGQRFRYVTNIRWNNGYVQPNIPVEIRVDVGYGRFQGREARVRGFYVPGGNAEENWYGPTGWVRHIPAGVA